MPKIKSVIQADRPFDAEKDILKVVKGHPYYCWSTSLEDLEELALWMMDPGNEISSLPVITKCHPPDGPVTLNSRFTVRLSTFIGIDPIRRTNSTPLAHLYRSGRERSTPTLRTVRDTLLNLHKKGLIAKIELHGGYYASLKSKSRILKRIEEKDTFKFEWQSAFTNPRSNNFIKTWGKERDPRDESREAP